ncbi:MAG: glycoside hydrolase family 76 protein [Bacteroidia bacterium]|nr:glycoside hydrolase family 76 protein [Bacteroidia bacterium]
MNQPIIHVYMMPGMAASPTIFEHIQLPRDRFEIHLLEWKIPYKSESLQDYAKRMCTEINSYPCVLIGVSFGGVLVQEMSRFINTEKVIIISSVKSKYELPRRMRMARKTKAYKLIPTQLAGNIEALVRFSFGKTVDKRLALYQKYLSVNDPAYLDWAIKNMICWDRAEPLPGVIHIHGDNDMVFPIKYIDRSMVVKDGTHVMIINKYRWFNKNLPDLIIR